MKGFFAKGHQTPRTNGLFFPFLFYFRGIRSNASGLFGILRDSLELSGTLRDTHCSIGVITAYHAVMAVEEPDTANFNNGESSWSW